MRKSMSMLDRPKKAKMVKSAQDAEELEEMQRLENESRVGAYDFVNNR